jgi:predicted ATPase
VSVLPVETIAERLNDRFRLLTGGSRAALPRQQTLRALIDWSYDLLDAGERTLFARLSVFAGGWTLAAAERVGAGDPLAPDMVLDLLAALAQKSLVAPIDSGARFRMLETIRDYARDRLQESGAEAAVRARHRDYFVALAEEAEPHLEGGAEQPSWLGQSRGGSPSGRGGACRGRSGGGARTFPQRARDQHRDRQSARNRVVP